MADQPVVNVSVIPPSKPAAQSSVIALFIALGTAALGVVANALATPPIVWSQVGIGAAVAVIGALGVWLRSISTGGTTISGVISTPPK